MRFRDYLAQRVLALGDRNWYGNYCGPGPALSKPDCNKLLHGGSLPPAKDGVDDACRVHDIDYCLAGKDWRAALPLRLFRSPDTVRADQEFIKKINYLFKNSKLSREAEVAAKLILLYFNKVTPKSD
jgi:hypothetical protein